MSALSTVDRRRLWREAASLSRGRLGRTTGARLGRWASWGLLVGFGVATLAARYGEGAPADLSGPLSGFAPSAARFAAWLAAGPIALAAANGRSARDRADGVDALASSFGVAASALRAGRLAGVGLACARAIAVPSIGVALIAAGLATSIADVTAALVVVPVLALFATVAGALLGALAVLAEYFAPERGMRALVLLIVVPWVASDLAGWAGASIPSALDALLTTGLGLASEVGA